MCGIAGIRFKHDVPPGQLDSIAAHFVASLHHRGPDSHGVHRGARSVFVNVRLAIVDRAGGDQPIYAPDGRRGIVYNGEVYNWAALRAPLEAAGYPFHTHTDTEAVLAAVVRRGEDAFADMNGMFAACVWDEDSDSFLLARDRFGAKPLYLYEDERMFAFASELKALLGLPGVDLGLNPLAFQDYLTYRYSLAPYSFFNRIERLPAGCVLRYDAAGRQVRRYARIDMREPAAPRAAEDYVAELDGLLAGAVRSQLMGEVPIGLLLSGGLDSSAIACYVQRAGARMKAYNIGFAEVNEFEFSRDVARQFDLDYVEICMTREELLAGMEDTILRLDEPIADPACFALSRLCRTIRDDVTVVLSGEGGDEMFAGYGQHLYALDPALDRNAAFAHFFHASANNIDAPTLLRNKALPLEHLRYKLSAYDPADTALNGMLAFELSTWMPENLMMKADKVLMSHSLEGRFPFLDLDLYRFAAALPQAMKLPSPASSKHVLRRLMADKLPASVIERRKMGFTVPPVFFLQHLRERFREALDLAGREGLDEVLDLPAVRQLVDAFYAGQSVPVFKVWNLFVLVYWFAFVYPRFRAGSNPLAAAARPSRAVAPPVPQAAPLATAGTGGRPRLAVYTVLVGAKEALNDPLCLIGPGQHSDIDVDFICFTDNPALRSPTWRMVLLDDVHLPPERQSRRPKCMPHEYLPDYEYSLYVDNTVGLKRLPCAADLASEGAPLLRMFKHPTRSTIEEEADVIISVAYADLRDVCDQVEHNRERVPKGEYPRLSTATVILRAHHAPAVRRFGIVWWEEFLRYSQRDQLAVDFAAWRAGCEIGALPGSIKANDLLQWPIDIGQHRVKANFDVARYVWQNRHDPAAVADPRGHYLRTQGEHHGITHCARRVEMFEYLCFKFGSSLGARVSPRRAVADVLGDKLLARRETAGRCLVARVASLSTPLAFAPEEMEPAALALAHMLPRMETQTLDIEAAALRDPQPMYDAGDARPFDMAVLLGVAPDDAVLVPRKLARMIGPSGGALLMLLAGRAGIATIEAVRQTAQGLHGRPVEVSIYASRHDAADLAIDNSVLLVEWPAAG